MKDKLNPNDVAWWRGKLQRGATRLDREGHRGFGPISAGHAVRIFDILTAAPSHRIDALDIRTLATIVGLPTKFIPRAVAMLTRSGTVRAELMPAAFIELRPNLLKRRKNSAQSPPRQPLSPIERERVLSESGFKCGHCDHTFEASHLEVDHVIPICVLGADAPANWVALCRPHNRDKWDAFDRDFLRSYRGERVRQPIGVRFRAGFFWPVVNGRLRFNRRD